MLKPDPTIVNKMLGETTAEDFPPAACPRCGAVCPASPHANWPEVILAKCDRHGAFVVNPGQETK